MLKENIEYELYKKVNKYKLPKFLKYIIFILLLILAIPQIILPIFPGSLIVGIIMLLVWFLIIIKPNKIKYLKKLRKWIIHIIKNFFNKKVWNLKINDFKKHLKKIFKKPSI